MSANSLESGEARAFERRLIQTEFRSQPPHVQRVTLDRILALLVEEHQRRPNQPSALWQRMGDWGFTPNLVRLESERGRR